ncbi:MAG: hypothetical protein ABL919_02745 [Methylococcales bacterium]|nr:hypothetical protein [Methylococcaceae bacterium]
MLTDGKRPIEIHSIASNGRNDALLHGPRVVTLTDLKTAAGVIQQAAKSFATNQFKRYNP